MPLQSSSPTSSSPFATQTPNGMGSQGLSVGATARVAAGAALGILVMLILLGLREWRRLKNSGA